MRITLDQAVERPVSLLTQHLNDIDHLEIHRISGLLLDRGNINPFDVLSAHNPTRVLWLVVMMGPGTYFKGLAPAC